MTRELLLKGYRVPLTPSTLFEGTTQSLADIKIGDIYWNQHRNVYATAEGHLFRNFHPMKDSSHHRDSLTSRIFGMRFSQIRNAYRYSARCLFKPIPLDSGYWVTHNHSYNYYHWVIESLPKLYLIAQRDPGARILLPHWMEDRTFVHDSLALLGFKDIRFVPKGHSFRVERMCTIDTATLQQEILFALRDRFREWAAESDGAERIYLSRNDAKRRRVANEAEIIEIVKRNGFRVIETGRLSLKEQVRLMRNCKILTTLHGAGLTNMLFMPSGGKIIEFRTYNELYIQLASVLGHKHYSLPSEKVGDKTAYYTDAYVDPAILESAIKKIVA